MTASNKKKASGRRITLCIQVSDNSSAVGTTLSALRPTVDEIVVVCRGDIDADLERIASEAGASLFSSPAEDSVGAALNLAIEKASGDWILYLEAGETLGGGADHALLTDTVRHPDLNAYALTILYGSDPDGQEVDANGHCADPRGVPAGSSVRLFRRSPEFRFDPAGELHVPPRVTVGALDIHVHTAAFRTSHPADDSQSQALFEKATELLDVGELEEAERLLREAAKMLSGPSPLGGAIMRNLAFSLIHQGRSRQALRVLKDATEAYPDFSDLFYLTGLAFYDLEEYLPALRNFEFALTKGDAPPAYGGWPGIGSYRSQREMAEVFVCMNDLDRAEQYFRAALVSNSADGFAMEGLGEILLTRVSAEEALSELEEAADFSVPEVLESAVELFRRTKEPKMAQLCEERLAGLDGRN